MYHYTEGCNDFVVEVHVHDNKTFFGRNDCLHHIKMIAMFILDGNVKVEGKFGHHISGLV